MAAGPSPSDTSLGGFGLPWLRAVALASRAAKGEGLEEWEAAERAIAAYLRFGGTREDAGRDLYRMLAAVSAQHGEWFSRPERERLARERAALEAASWWPGPVIRTPAANWWRGPWRSWRGESQHPDEPPGRACLRARGGGPQDRAPPPLRDGGAADGVRGGLPPDPRGSAQAERETVGQPCGSGTRSWRRRPPKPPTRGFYPLNLLPTVRTRLEGWAKGLRRERSISEANLRQRLADGARILRAVVVEIAATGGYVAYLRLSCRPGYCILALRRYEGPRAWSDFRNLRRALAGFGYGGPVSVFGEGHPRLGSLGIGTPD